MKKDSIDSGLKKAQDAIDVLVQEGIERCQANSRLRQKNDKLTADYCAVSTENAQLKAGKAAMVNERVFMEEKLKWVQGGRELLYTACNDLRAKWESAKWASEVAHKHAEKLAEEIIELKEKFQRGVVEHALMKYRVNAAIQDQIESIEQTKQLKAQIGDSARRLVELTAENTKLKQVDADSNNWLQLYQERGIALDKQVSQISALKAEKAELEKIIARLQSAGDTLVGDNSVLISKIDTLTETTIIFNKTVKRLQREWDVAHAANDQLVRQHLEDLEKIEELSTDKKDLLESFDHWREYTNNQCREIKRLTGDLEVQRREVYPDPVGPVGLLRIEV